MTYRVELDGIRAIAVLSVVLFHAGLSIFSGGYVGVDIFFVLSGYLITHIIYKQIKASSFTFSDFYWRRFRRILPALFFMILVVGLIGYYILYPVTYKDFGTSAWTAALFSSNIYFWTEAGYFQKAAELKPLLHTWSLGVEEQYYIFFPILMIIIAKWAPKKFFVLLALVGGGSLILSIIGVYFKPIATFYLLPTRLWELLIGSLLAVSNLPTLHNKNTINVISWSGLMMLALPIFFYSKDTLFPGLAALPPCLGTALIIWSLNNEYNTSLKRVLSFKPFAFVGKVSYSFYLWHWPVLILCGYYAYEELSLMESLLAIVVAFIVACFSWMVIEKPFRSNFQLFPKQRMLNISYASIIMVASLGIIITFQNGMASRFDIDLVKVIGASDDKSRYSTKCSDQNIVQLNSDLCGLGLPSDTQPKFLLWGDSHSGAMAPVFDFMARELSITGKLANWSGCPPLLGIQRGFNGSKRDCLSGREAIIDYIEQNPSLETVILSARWGMYVENKAYNNEKNLGAASTEYFGKKVQNHAQIIHQSLENTVSWLRQKNKRVVIIMPVPEVGFDVPTTIAKSIIRSSQIDIRPRLSAFEKRQSKFFEITNDLAQEYDVTLLYPHELMCDQDYCQIMTQGTPLYFDDDHLSTFGAMQLKEIASKALIH